MEVERYFADTVTVLKDGCFVRYQDFEKVKLERDASEGMLKDCRDDVLELANYESAETWKPGRAKSTLEKVRSIDAFLASIEKSEKG